jgi:Protein of unknown function (DUF4240)
LKPTTGLLVLGLLTVVAGYLLGSGGDSGGKTPGDATTRAAAAPQAMDEAAFWQLTADTRQAAGGDTERQSELLEERLRRLPGEQIAEFQRIRHRLDEQAYSWELWGAAYVIEDGCSDDCFRDFRAYLISLGRAPYEAALRDPDSLAPVVEDAETGDWENADSVAGDAYESAVGEDIPADDSDLSGDPLGEPWDDEDQDALAQRYPRLAERFR